MNPNKICIVNFASGDYYKRGQDRLVQSVKDYDVLTWNKEEQLGVAVHRKNPYGFKPCCVRQAIELGYKTILWLDASIYAVKDLKPIFDEIQEVGYIFVPDGWNAAQWCSDHCLSSFNTTRDEAINIPMIRSGVLGLSVDSPIAMEFQKQWLDHSLNKDTFFGDWNNDRMQVSQDTICLGHRHDQSVATMIKYKLGMNFWKTEHCAFNYVNSMTYNKAMTEDTLEAHHCLFFNKL